MGLFTYAGEVSCPTCGAKQFMPCIYADTSENRKRKCVGLPILKNGFPYFHNDRQYAQSHWEWLHVRGQDNYDRLSIWLAEYGDIFAE
jgi:hypothetical protein